jgi:hypothetical protein
LIGQGCLNKNRISRHDLAILSAIVFVSLIIVLFSLQAVRSAPLPPTVQTDPADNNFLNQATLHGEITNTGGEDCNERGFDWRPQSDSAWQSWTQSSGPYGTGSFSHTLTGLTSGAVYAFRAKAHNSAGWSYGSILNFRVIAKPTLQTTPATNITTSSATLNTKIFDNGGADLSSICFRYEKPGSYWTDLFQSGSFGPVTEFSDGVEDGTLPPFESKGDLPWDIDSNAAEVYTGGYCAKSGRISDKESSSLALKASVPNDESNLRFAYRVSSEEDSDYLAFYIDEVESGRWSGEVGWQEVNVSIPAGDHALEWRYEKDDDRIGAGADAAWIDDVRITSPRVYSMSATGLDPGTLYEFFIIGTNYAGYTNGDLLQFTTTTAVPTMSTSDASLVSSNGATLNGSIVAVNTPTACEERGFDWRMQGQGDDEWQSWTESAGSYGTGSFSHAITSLASYTTYEVRSKARNSVGWGYGNVKTFTTDFGPPAVRADPATNVTVNSATLNGYIVNTGGLTCDWRGFQYKRHDDSYWDGPGEEHGSWGTGPFTLDISGLSPGTAYDFRCYAHNARGFTISDPVTFTTLGSPSVATSAASGITAVSATLNGSINDTWGIDCDERGFDWHRQGDAWQSVTESPGPYGDGPFSHTITGLSPNVTYEFIAKAHNQAGWGSGSTLTFTTPALPPTVTTDPPEFGEHFGMLHGSITGVGGQNCDLFEFQWHRPGDSWSSWSQGQLDHFQFGISSWSWYVGSLDPDTTVEFRFRAHNSAGWTDGDTLTFTTLHTAVLRTDPATDITTTSAVLHGEILDTGGIDCNQRGFYVRKVGAPNWGGEIDYDNYPAGPYTKTVSGLDPGCDYEFKAYAYTPGTTANGFGDILTFRTAVPCVLQTEPATNVATTSADVQGLITDTGGENCDQHGFQWRKQGETDWLTWAETGDYSNDVRFSDGFEDGTIAPLGTGGAGYPAWTADLTGAGGSAYCAKSPMIYDTQTTYISCAASQAKRISFNFKVSSEEGYDYLIFNVGGREVARWSGQLGWQNVSFEVAPGQHYFEWWYQKDGSVSSGFDCAWIDDVRIDTPFDHHITGLDPGTSYEFRAKAHKSTGWSYGDTRILATESGPELDTDEATNVDRYSATLNGEITSQGTEACDQRGFDYRAAGQETWQSCSDIDPAPYGPGSYSGTVSGLEAGTRYSFRAKALNAGGLSYGEVLTFETKDVPTMETDDATSVDHQSAVLNGVIASTGGVNCTERGFQWRKQGETGWQTSTESGSYSSERINFGGDFEDGTLNGYFCDKNYMYLNLDWRAEASDAAAYTGAYCARSPVIPDAKLSPPSVILGQMILGFSPAVNIPGDNYRIRFARKVSSEQDHDLLMFYVANSAIDSGRPQFIAGWSGEVPWGTVTYPVPEGDNAFYWRYQKENTEHSGTDAAWIDDIVIESTIPFSHKIEGLDMGTTYEFRSLARNQFNTADPEYGPTKTFRTAEYSATRTDPASSLTGSSAVLNGQITYNGGEDCDERGFEYRKKGSAGWQSWTENGSFGETEFQLSLSGLKPKTGYEFRAKAHNSAGWSFGAITTFTTPANLPTVVTGGAADISSGSASLNGRTTDNGGENCDQRGFDFRKHGSAVWQSWMEKGSFGEEQFQHDLPGLEPKTAYEFRAKAHNSAGWSHGKTLTFTTKSLTLTGSSTWYLAEGSTAYGFDCYITIENPNPDAVTAQITYMTGSGAVKAADVDLPAMSQATINPASKLGNQDFSTKVVCKEGKAIAVDRTMSWTGTGASSPEAHSSIGVTSAAKTWYLPEGSSAWGFECWLLIQNPSSQEASCDVTFMIEGGTPKTVNHKVPASSRKTFSMQDDIGTHDASIKVVSNIPVIPERAMYKNNRREGHDSIGTTSPAKNYYLAEGTTAYGFTTYVLIQNPNNKDNQVTVTYMTPWGPKPQAPFTMSANSRKTIRVNDIAEVADTDLSTKVSGTLPLIAERAMYWVADTPFGEATHDSIGMSSPHTTFYLPDGETSEGRETWTLVQNPNSSPVTVQISYLTPSGKGGVVFTDTIAPNSRKTYNMADKGIQGRAAVMVTSKTSGKKIMCERAMYWNSRGAGTDTIGGFSD